MFALLLHTKYWGFIYKIINIALISPLNVVQVLLMGERTLSPNNPK
jgi:hypothetical protein